jgi:hypothetical protein
VNEQEFQRLCSAIEKYGLDNISTLSRYARIPVETARYMVWYELPKRYLFPCVDIDYRRIGLGRLTLLLEASNKHDMPTIEDYLKKNAGLVFGARVVPNMSYFAILAIPLGEQHKLKLELTQLTESKIIESYAMSEIQWMKYVSFNPKFYDLKQRRWLLEWQDLALNLRLHRESPLDAYSPEGKRGQREEKRAAVDLKDLLILKEFQRRVPRSLSKLAHELDLDSHNIRYHYMKHARWAIRGYFLRMAPKESTEYQSSLVFCYEHACEEFCLPRARTIAISLPFTTSEWRSKEGYYWTVSCPGECTNTLLRFVSEKFSELPGKLKFFILDSKTEYNDVLPYHLFDGKNNKWKYDPKIHIEKLVSIDSS